MYLIDRVRGPYWENIGPSSWPYEPSRFSWRQNSLASWILKLSCCSWWLRHFHAQQLPLVFPDCFKCPNQAQSGGPSSPGLELLCVSRRKFANHDFLRIRHFEKFDFRSDVYGTGLILEKYHTGNSEIWFVDFLLQPSPGLSRVIKMLLLGKA